MKTRKMISAATALCIAVCPALPAAYTSSPSAPCLAASAAEETEFTSGFLTFRKSGIDACLVSCDKDAVGEIDIAAHAENLRVSSIAEGAFKDCKGITSVITDYGTWEIGDHAFEGCENLESIELQDTIMNIGSYAFAGCTSLKAPELPRECEIGSFAFRDCTSFTSIELPKNMTKVSEGLLEGCTSLTSIICNYCVTEIGKGAFRNCTKLKDVDLKVYAYKELETIGEEAFAGCEELETLLIPEGVVTLKDNVFAGCTSLTYIDLPTTLTDFDPHIFDDTQWKADIMSGDEGLIINDVLYEIPDVEELYIAYGVKRVASGAADNCPSLVTVRIYDYLETIDASAFSKCSTIKDVYYNGFESQWEALKKCSAAEGNEALFENAEVHLREDSLSPGDWYKLREGDLTYNIYTDHAEVTNRTDYYEGDIVIPSEVIGLPVTVIGYDAFYFSEQMTSVTIPDSITAIEPGAFSYCTGLTGISIPASVKSVGNYAFSGCTSLIEVDLPEPLPEIGTDAFEGTPWLEKYKQETHFIVFEGVLLKYTADGGDVVIPEGVRKIGSGAFEGNDITSVVIPDSVTQIGEYAFSYCRFLNDIDIPDSVTDIGPGAFSRTSVSELTIPGSIKRPDCRLFEDTDKLEKVTFLEGTEVIADYQFTGYDQLRSVSLPDTVTEIGEYAFSGCRRLKDFKIPESVTRIGPYAFDSCRSLISVTVPEGVKELDHTFSNCYALREVYLPASLEEIDHGAFRHSDALTDIYYAGTEEDWEKLLTASRITPSDKVFYDAVIHFNPAPPAPVMYGDANGDGKITVSDAVAVLQYIANAEKYPIAEELLVCADCDGEAGITGSDAIMIQRFDAGLIDIFPAEKK